MATVNRTSRNSSELDARVLAAVRDAPGAGVAELARHRVVDRAAVNVWKALRRLEVDGLVEIQRTDAAGQKLARAKVYPRAKP